MALTILQLVVSNENAIKNAQTAQPVCIIFKACSKELLLTCTIFKECSVQIHWLFTYFHGLWILKT